MRAFDYLHITADNLRRQPLRSLLTVIALVISTVILIVMIALSIGARQAIVSQYGSDLSAITVTPNQAGGGLSIFGSVQHVSGDPTAKLTDQTAADLAKLPHVISSVPRTYIWEFHDFTINGYSRQFLAQTQGVPSDDHIPLAAGRYFASNDETHAVIIGLGYANDLGVTDPGKLVGKKISIVTQPGYRGADAVIPPANASTADNAAFAKTPTTLSATIVGVTGSGPDQNSLLIPLGWAHQVRTARGNDSSSVDQLAKDGYTSIKLSVDSDKNIDSVSKAVAERDLGQFSAKAQIEQIQQLTTVLWIVLGTVALIAALAAALGITNTMLMTVTEQRYIIGVWRAVGARRSTIVRLFLLQATALGLIGGLVGSALAYAASYSINAYAAGLLRGQGLSVTTIIDVSPGLIAATIIFTTTFGMLAGLYPAYKAARQDPSDALRGGQ